MPGTEKEPNREEDALLALISAALHVKTDEVSLDEIRPYLTSEIGLSSEDEAALNASRNPRQNPTRIEAEGDTPESEAFMALNRKRPQGGFSQKTEEAIKLKRQELLEKLHRKKGSS